MIDKMQALWTGDISRTIIILILHILMYVVGTKLTDFIIKAISRRLDNQAIHWRFAKNAIKGILAFIVIYGIASSVPALDKFITTIVASSTIFIAAIGLASQDSVSNIVSGIFISVFKPFAVGDRVKLVSNGLIGIIEDINLRHTIIRTIENNRIIVPNTTMNKEIVENSNYYDRRIYNFLDIKITYESDVRRAKEIICEEVMAHHRFTDWRNDEERKNNVPLVNVLLRDLTNNCIELRAGIWSVDIGASFQTCSDLRESILIRFISEGIQLYRFNLGCEKYFSSAQR